MTHSATEYSNQLDLYDNPIGLNGFECVEFASSNPSSLQKLFDTLGFTPVGRHKTQNVMLYRQGDLNFLVNGEPDSFASQFNTAHGPCACAMGFRVEDARLAYQRLIDRGAEPFQGKKLSFDVPAIYGIGGSVIYLMDNYTDHRVYLNDFEPLATPSTKGVGFTNLDHLTHNVAQGNMDKWANFYVKLFNFREIRYFDIKGQHTGLLSRAMTSPCNKIRIPINEGTEKESQIEEYLREYNGEGIQHIAFETDDIFYSVETLRERGVKFLDFPDTYYELLDARLPGHGEDTARMQKNRILLDGDMDKPGKPHLLQIFTDTVIGPIFFEIIQRKGHQGFGEGNFQALFEAMELDQVRRGVLK